MACGVSFDEISVPHKPSADVPKSTSLSLGFLSNHARALTLWIVVTLVSEPNMEVRVAIARKFIRTAMLCIDMNDYCSAHSIYQAFEHPAVTQLESTLLAIGFLAIELLRGLKNIFAKPIEPSTSSSYPLIEPALLLETELNQIEDVDGPNFLNHAYLNLKKMRRIYDTLERFLPESLLGESTPIDSLALDPLICSFLGLHCDVQQADLFSDDVLIGLAEKRKPSEIVSSPMARIAEARASQLQSLDLSTTNIPVFAPRLIEELVLLAQTLTVLNVSNTGLIELPYAVNNLTKLEVLDVSSNNLDSLPYILPTMRTLKKFSYKGNPLTSIPEKARQSKTLLFEFLQRKHRMANVGNAMAGPAAGVIRSTFQSVKISAEAPNLKWPLLKLCALGKPGSGKDTLIEQLLERCPSPSARKRSTKNEVSEVRSPWLARSSAWIDQQLELDIWGLSCLSPYIPTHTLFLTKKTCTLLVFSLADFEVGPLEHWARQISAISHPPPPIICVGTHLDKVTIERAKQVVAFLQERLKKHANIIGIQVFSSVTHFGLDQIVQLVQKASELKSVGTSQFVPNSWWVLQRYLRTPHSIPDQTFITLGEFNELALECGVKEPPNQVLDFLTESGTLLHYDDKFSGMNNLVFLSPAYVATAVFSLLTLGSPLLRNGLFFHLEDLKSLWTNYESIKDSLFGLLYQHHLCFPFSPEICLLPDLFPADPPVSFFHTQTPVLSGVTFHDFVRVFVFPSLPDGFFGSLCVRLLAIREMISMVNPTIWRNGLYLPSVRSSELIHTLILFDPELAVLTVCFRVVLRDSTSSLDQFSVLRWVFESIENLLDGSYASLKIQTRGLVPCPLCLTAARKEQLRSEHDLLSIRDYLCPAICKWIDENPLEQDSSSTPTAGSSATTPRSLTVPQILLPNEGVVIEVPPIHFFSLDDMTALIESEQVIRCSHNHGVTLPLLAPDYAFCDIVEIPANQVVIEKEIGKGAFGEVRSGIWLADQDAQALPIALKELSVSTEPQVVQDFLHELLMMKNLDHPNIVRCLGIMRRPLRIVSEYCSGGDLSRLLQTEHLDVPLYFRLKLGIDIASGLIYLHTRSPPLIHRDLRTPNIFLALLSTTPTYSTRGHHRIESSMQGSTLNQLVDSLPSTAPLIQAKIGDFGLARRAPCSGLLASWRFLAPECIDPEVTEYDHMSDIYSFGLLLFELLTRTMPFDQYFDDARFSRALENGSTVINQQGIVAAIIHDDLRPTIPTYCPIELAALLQECWGKDPLQRPSAENVREKLTAITSALGFEYKGID